jgi:hypothetical protein
MKRSKTLVLIHSLLALRVIVSLAQQVTPDTGLIGSIEGKVYLNEKLVELSADPVHVYANSIVRSEDGRAEVRLAGGVSLFLGENSSFKLTPNGPYNFSRLELLEGSIVIATGELGSLVQCENQVTLSDAGLYRFDVIKDPGPDQMWCGFKVYKGAAAVLLATVTSVLTRGNATTLSLACGDHAGYWTFDPEQADALDNWSRQRIRLRRAQ